MTADSYEPQPPASAPEAFEGPAHSVVVRARSAPPPTNSKLRKRWRNRLQGTLSSLFPPPNLVPHHYPTRNRYPCPVVGWHFHRRNSPLDRNVNCRLRAPIVFCECHDCPVWYRVAAAVAYQSRLQLNLLARRSRTHFYAARITRNLSDDAGASYCTGAGHKFGCAFLRA